MTAQSDQMPPLPKITDEMIEAESMLRWFTYDHLPERLKWIRTHLRTSRKLRRCDCGTWIHAGDQYLEQVISPDHGDVGNAGWWRASECRACAVRYDRWPIQNGAVMQR